MTRLLHFLAIGVLYGLLTALSGWGLDSVLRRFDIADFNRGLLVGCTVATVFQAISEIQRWRKAR